MHNRTSIIRTLLLYSILIAINAPAIAQHHHHNDAVSTTAQLSASADEQDRVGQAGGGYTRS